MEYDRQAQGQVTSLGGATPVMLPFIPTHLEISNPARATAVNGVTRAWWEIAMGNGAAMLTTTVAGPTDGTSYIAAATGTGFSAFIAYASNLYGPVVPITTVTAGAAPTVIVCPNPHNLITGDVVVFTHLNQTATTGMQGLSGIPWVVTYVNANNFSINIDTAAGATFFTTYNSGTAIDGLGSCKKILYPFLYAPGVADISAIVLGAQTTVTTTSPHNFVVGQQVAFRIPAPYGTVQLNSLPNITIPGSPVYGYVTAVNSAVQIVVNINSTGYTAFTYPLTAQVIAGLGAAQILAVGDNNSGSNQFGYQSPIIPTFGGAHTINGPAIAGAYLNNSAMGFIIGSGVAGTAGDQIMWRACFAPIR